MSAGGTCVIPQQQLYVDVLNRLGELDQELKFNKFTTIVSNMIEDASLYWKSISEKEVKDLQEKVKAKIKADKIIHEKYGQHAQQFKKLISKFQ